MLAPRIYWEAIPQYCPGVARIRLLRRPKAPERIPRPCLYLSSSCPYPLLANLLNPRVSSAPPSGRTATVRTTRARVVSTDLLASSTTTRPHSLDRGPDLRRIRIPLHVGSRWDARPLHTVLTARQIVWGPSTFTHLPAGTHLTLAIDRTRGNRVPGVTGCSRAIPILVETLRFLLILLNLEKK